MRNICPEKCKIGTGGELRDTLDWGGTKGPCRVTFDLILQWVSRMSQPWGNESNRIFRVLIDAFKSSWTSTRWRKGRGLNSKGYSHSNHPLKNKLILSIYLRYIWKGRLMTLRYWTPVVGPVTNLGQNMQVQVLLSGTEDSPKRKPGARTCKIFSGSRSG